MDALFFLFRRRLSDKLRTAAGYVGYETSRQDLSERLYGLYIVVILAAWAFGMLAWAVATLAGILVAGRVLTTNLQPIVFVVLALLLIITPLISFGNRDFFRFSLADLNFISSTPLPPTLIALGWFGKAFFSLPTLLMGVGAAVIGSALRTVAKENDWIGLSAGAAAGLLFTLTLSGISWLFGLSRYRHDKPPKYLGWLVSLAGLAVLVVVPLVQAQIEWRGFGLIDLLFWPAYLTAYLLAGHLVDGLAIAAIIGLLITAVAGIVLIYRLARTLYLAPALEGGRIGALMRLAASLGGDANREARQQARLENWQNRSANSTTGPRRMNGPLLTLLYRQWLGLIRRAWWQMVGQALLIIVPPVLFVIGLMFSRQASVEFGILIVTSYYGNVRLIKVGTDMLRRELTHFAYLINWPLSRQNWLNYGAVLGFLPTMLIGEITALTVLLTGASSDWWWLIKWPFMLTVTGLIGMLLIKSQVRKWAGDPENVPYVGGGLPIIAAIIWVVLVWLPHPLDIGLLVGGVFTLAATYLSN